MGQKRLSRMTEDTTMPQPCEQADTIRAIKRDQEVHRRETSQKIDAMIDAQQGLIKEQREFMRELRDYAVQDRDHDVRIQRTEKDVDECWQRIRHFDDNVFPSIRKGLGDLREGMSRAISDSEKNICRKIEKVETRTDALEVQAGQTSVLGKAIPTICTVISVIIALWAVAQ